VADFDESFLVKKIQGRTDEAEDLMIAAWLSESEENMKIYARMKALWQARKAATYTGDPGIEESINKINARIDLISFGQKRIRKMRLLKYAAVITLLIGLGAVVWQMQIHRNNPTMITIVNSINGGVKCLELADGTVAWLNTGSRLSYPDRFEKNRRMISVEGEVYLEVTKDAKRHFLVNTPALTIEVTGTSFNVNTNAAGKVQVVLVEGSVNLLESGGEKIGSLLPGQMVSADPGDGSIEIRAVNTRLYTSWQEGLVILKKTELKDILTRIEGIYNVKFMYDSALINNNHSKYNFVFRKSQSFDTVFEMLKFVAPVKDIRVKRKTNDK